jgi:predicted  nucleic acid-binding Zn-ribbon protein
VDALEEQVAELAAREESARRQLADATADLDADMARLKALRAEAAAGIEPGLIELYEKVRASVNLSGVAVAALENGRCSGCRVDLAPQELQRMRVLSADAVIRCEECRRILVRVELAGSAGAGIPA